MKIGFDSNKFIEAQKIAIQERIAKNNGKLYMEMGGKIFDDLHASRVLPGYRPDNKIKILESMKDDLEIIICISAKDIEKNKIRADFGITYDMEVLRLIDGLKGSGLSVNSVCINLFNEQPSAIKFANILKRKGEKVYFHYMIDGYPNNIDKICSEEGYGKNDYIKTTKPLVVVSAPGPGSGKLSTCLSQMYHDHKHGIKSGYAKFESFPVWNLPVDHPVNIAYESATADLNDYNLIDPYHLNTYGIKATNYNRDTEAFPILQQILLKIAGSSPYNSPTDMGVNRVALGIIDDKACKDASKQEIIRRYLKAKVEFKKGLCSFDCVKRTSEIMDGLKLKLSDRKVLKYAHEMQRVKKNDVVTIELSNGSLVYGKNQGVITATTGAVLNALRELGNIQGDTVIDRQAVKNIASLKETLKLGQELDLKDIFIALSIMAEKDINSKIALEQIPNLIGCEVHSTYILSNEDENFLRKLKANVTCDDTFLSNKLYK